MPNAEILKHTRTEEREDRSGRMRPRVVTTWDLVHDGVLISECRTRKEAIARAKEYNRTQTTPDGRTPIAAVRSERPARLDRDFPDALDHYND